MLKPQLCACEGMLRLSKNSQDRKRSSESLNSTMQSGNSMVHSAAVARHNPHPKNKPNKQKTQQNSHTRCSLLEFRARLLRLLNNVPNNKNSNFPMMRDPRSQNPISNLLLKSSMLTRTYLIETVRLQNLNYFSLRKRPKPWDAKHLLELQRQYLPTKAKLNLRKQAFVYQGHRGSR
jgi:hypothetical protein